jgi:hypothetical protein
MHCYWHAAEDFSTFENVADTRTGTKENHQCRSM